jgi:alkanesulfonate monooxygenase SsuD/methylene tetrahydromethanopterin reductase-like flavin-dependent oxidoreductase (luciferase family)
LLVALARRAEELGFSTLGTIGRLAFPTFEELITLGAAAAVTERIGLMTDILLATTREPVLLAKQAATLDQISGGRFVLGVGVGGREDDFAVSGYAHHGRGKRMDAYLEVMHRAWRGDLLSGTTERVTPQPVNGTSVPVIIGGHSDRALARIARYGIGYTLGGGTPESLAKMIERVNTIWKEAGREGKPEFRALRYFALGDDVAAEAEQNIRAYYGEYAARSWAATIKTAEDARELVKAFAGVGCDELILFMAAPHLDQAERLATAIF